MSARTPIHAAAMTPKQLRHKIKGMPAHQALTVECERALSARSQRLKPVWYVTQKQHWLGWLAGYDGPGAYGRKDWNRSAEFVYNHIGCPPMLVWLNEAAGVPAARVRAAVVKALQRQNMAVQCGMIRQALPWAVVGALLNGR